MTDWEQAHAKAKEIFSVTGRSHPAVVKEIARAILEARADECRKAELSTGIHSDPYSRDHSLRFRQRAEELERAAKEG